MKLRKLVCFSEKTFGKLKELFGKLLFKKESFFPEKDEEHQKRKDKRDKIQLQHLNKTEDFLNLITYREKAWWVKENWKGMYNSENPWMDLSKGEEHFLKNILKRKK